MSVLTVPFHLDERLDPSRLLLSPDHTVDPDLPAGTAWQRMAVLYEHLATAVSRAQRPTVLSGDCTSALGVLAGLQRTGVDPVGSRQPNLPSWRERSSRRVTPYTSPPSGE